MTPARIVIAIWLVLVAAGPLYLPEFYITLVNYIGLYSLVALGLVLLTGIAGLTSFGQAAFVGVGAYATAVASTQFGHSPWLGLPALVGYEWHRGRTALGPEARALAEVEVGVCNGGDPPTDGAVQGRVLGTYLHGPLLPRNPELADLLLGWALDAELEPLESEFAGLAREERIAEAREIERRQHRRLRLRR